MKTLRALYIIAMAAICCACASGISVERLQCEFLTDPLAIDKTDPQLSWVMESSRNGTSSTAYQVLAATDPTKLNEKDADLWDTGKVEATNEIKVKYAGEALKPKDFVYWKVRVWNQEGKPSKWSSPASFGIGLLQNSDWNPGAAYIGLADNGKSPEEAPLLRKSFKADKKGDRILLHVNSLGYHEAYINGLPVSDAVLTPAVCEFDTRSLIVTYDVTSLVKKGDNEIVFHLGKGWYQDATPGAVAGGPYVRAQMDAYIDGTVKTLVSTDESWMSARSNRKSFGVWRYRKLGGEIVDSRYSLPDMKKASLDALEWAKVITIINPVMTATPQMCELNRITESHHPVSVQQVSDSCYIYDFGITVVGFTEIMMPSLSEEKTVELHYDDLIIKDAKDFRDGTYTDLYIGCSNKGRFSSKFNYKAYRYIKIKGLPEALPLESITAYPIRHDYVSDASFECSDKDMNAICDMIHRTFHALTLGGDMVDCPHRERLGYGGDGHASTLSAQIMSDLAPLYMNWVQAYADSQAEDGSMPHTAPNPYRAGGGPFWCEFIIPASWQSYVNYGDRRLIESFYPNMKRWIEFAESNFKNGLLKNWGSTKHRHWYLGDWATPEGINQKDSLSIDIVSNCVMSHSYGLMSKIATVLGKDDEAAEFATKKETHNKVIHDTFYNEETGLYSTGTQVDMIFPLLVGATPDSLVSKVKNTLYDVTADRFKGHLSVGLVGVPVLTQWATENEEAEFMYSMLKKRDCPGYLYMIDNGAYTTWEYWHGIKSQIHNCYNGIGSWFYQALAGIRPDETQPGYKHVFIKPQLVSGVDWVKASKNTPYGKLSVELKKQADKFTISINIPVGSSATVCMPDGTQNILLTSGHHTPCCNL